MRIALVHTTLPNPASEAKDGGVTVFVHRLADRLVGAGHEVTVFSADPAPPGARYQVRPLPAPGWASRSFAARTLLLPLFLNRIPWRQFDAVHTHGDDVFFASSRRIRSLHGSALSELRSATSWRRRLGQAVLYPLETLSALGARVAVAQSDATRRDFPFVRRRLDYGVDLEAFHPGPKSPHPAVLFIGTLGGRKRGHLLVDVFNREVHPVLPTAELWMVADEPAPGAGVVNLGKLSDDRLAELCRSAWVFSMPSSYEGFGLPYLEAMASGTAVVTTPNPGALEILRGGADGLVVPDRQLGAALLRVLTDAGERTRLEAAGSARAAHYSWERVLPRHLALYAEVAGRAPEGEAAVAIYVPSIDTRAATELCVRSIRQFAGWPFQLTVGDGGSTDGSLEMLRELERRGWLRLEVAAGGRDHAGWLNEWRARQESRLAVFADSDVEFRRPGWLRDLVLAARAADASLVAAELHPESPFYVEPVGRTTVRGAERPAPWLMLVDLERTAHLRFGFEFHKEATTAVPEGMVIYDVGAMFLRLLKEDRLGWIVMPRSFGRKYHHYGGLSWVAAGAGRRGLKKQRDLRTVERHLESLRKRQ